MSVTVTILEEVAAENVRSPALVVLTVAAEKLSVPNAITCFSLSDTIICFAFCGMARFGPVPTPVVASCNKTALSLKPCVLSQ